MIFPHGSHDIPSRYWTPPTVLSTPHGTAHTLYRVVRFVPTFLKKKPNFQNGQKKPGKIGTNIACEQAQSLVLVDFNFNLNVYFLTIKVHITYLPKSILGEHSETKACCSSKEPFSVIPQCYLWSIKLVKLITFYPLKLLQKWQNREKNSN